MGRKRESLIFFPLFGLFGLSGVCALGFFVGCTWIPKAGRDRVIFHPGLPTPCSFYTGRYDLLRLLRKFYCNSSSLLLVPICCVIAISVSGALSWLKKVKSVHMFYQKKRCDVVVVCPLVEPGFPLLNPSRLGFHQRRRRAASGGKWRWSVSPYATFPRVRNAVRQFLEECGAEITKNK